MILQKSVFSDKHLVRISRPSWTFSRSLHSILTSGELEPNILFGEPVSPAGGGVSGIREPHHPSARDAASARCATPLCCLRTWRPGLSDRTDREFLIDYGFSVADINLGYSLHLANDRVPFDDLVHAKAYYDRLAARPAFQRAL